jgi:hypothetical protein
MPRGFRASQPAVQHSQRDARDGSGSGDSDLARSGRREGKGRHRDGAASVERLHGASVHDEAQGDWPPHFAGE